MTGHSKRATVALQKLVETDPAFGSLSLWCRHRDATPEMTTVFLTGTMGQVEGVEISYDIAPAYTDGRTIYYGRKFEDWDLDEQMAVCAHEILHIAFRHIPRGKTLSERLGHRYAPRLFNVATDALINEALARAEYKLPTPCIRLAPLLKDVLGVKLPADLFSSLDAETLYIRLLDALEADAASAQKIAALIDTQDVDIWPDGALTADERVEGAEWEQRVRRAFASGRAAGRGIGQTAHQLGDIPKTRTPWELILRRLVTKAVTRKPIQTFERPTRRWLALDADAQRRGLPCPAYQPGTRMGGDYPRIAVCLDVSGSIFTSLLERFAGEIARIGKRTGAEIHLIVFDDGIHLITMLKGVAFEAELKQITFRRGGGTSFVEPIIRAEELDPSAIVVLTDLHGPFGDKPRGIPVIWACPLSPAPQAPFGRVVTMAG